jgi:hypothetical protein
MTNGHDHLIRWGLNGGLKQPFQIPGKRARHPIQVFRSPGCQRHRIRSGHGHRPQGLTNPGPSAAGCEGKGNSHPLI